MTVERMYYGRYKHHYSDCETVPGSYDKSTAASKLFYLMGARSRPASVEKDFVATRSG